MGIFDLFKNKNEPSKSSREVVDYGKQKKDGSHDHRVNKGGDRTPAQKQGDKTRKKG